MNRRAQEDFRFSPPKPCVEVAPLHDAYAWGQRAFGLIHRDEDKVWLGIAVALGRLDVPPQLSGRAFGLHLRLDEGGPAIRCEEAGVRKTLRFSLFLGNGLTRHLLLDEVQLAERWHATGAKPAQEGTNEPVLAGKGAHQCVREPVLRLFVLVEDVSQSCFP